jgi:hypothetical protein
MELLKSNLIIDERYKPSLKLSYIDYFNRAMAFAQTNYQDNIEKVSRTQFNKLSPTRFFEEYVWSICCIHSTQELSSKLYPLLSKELKLYYNSFWDLNSFPKSEELSNKLLEITKDTIKANAINNTAAIVNKAIKLYGWEFYRDNFLNTPIKLTALPMLGVVEARHLARNIGSSSDIINNIRLHKLAVHWNFAGTKELCEEIQKCVPMQLKIIELILLYAASAFKC